jgi:hypothetical protein
LTAFLSPSLENWKSPSHEVEFVLDSHLKTSVFISTVDEKHSTFQVFSLNIVHSH